MIEAVARALRAGLITVDRMRTTTDDQLVSAAELARLLDTSYDSVKRLAAHQRWICGELPEPVEGSSPRRWRLRDIDAWLLANERLECAHGAL